MKHPGTFRAFHSRRLIGIAVTGMLLVSCARELTHQYALEQIASQHEFQTPYYAPMRIGEIVLTGEDFKNSDTYIRDRYGKLIDAGLVAATCTDRNSWRAVMQIELTEKGKAMSDPRRSTDTEAYVHVCRMIPTQVEEFHTLSEGNIVECVYLFEEQEVTPFGEFRGFEPGRSYKDKRQFVYSRGKWRLK